QGLRGRRRAGRMRNYGRHRARERESDSADRLERALVQLPSASLGLVGTLLLQARQVIGSDVAGDVLAGEAGRVERLDVRVVMQAGLHQVVQVLIDESIRADQPG